MKIVPSDICSAFQDQAIGSRVTQPRAFLLVVQSAIEKHDFSKDRIPGQALLSVPDAVPWVSSGNGRKSPDADRYHCREHRGVVSAYLKREFAEPAVGCDVVVYTREAYLNDPDVTPKEFARIGDATHVIVAVLAYADEKQKSPLPPYRLVWNLAGGNHEAALWTADEIRAKAKEAIAYNNDWSTVAD